MFRGQEEASTASIFCTSHMHDDTSACLVCALVLMWIVGLGMIPRRLSAMRIFCFFQAVSCFDQRSSIPTGCILVGVMQAPFLEASGLLGYNLFLPRLVSMAAQGFVAGIAEVSHQVCWCRRKAICRCPVNCNCCWRLRELRCKGPGRLSLCVISSWITLMLQIDLQTQQLGYL